VLETRDYFLKEINAIPELNVLVWPDSSLIAFGSKDTNISIYAVADELQKRGWYVDRQQHPESIHLTISPVHAECKEEYIQDLKEAVAHIKAHPELNTSGQAAMYGMMAKIPFRGMIKSSVQGLMEKMYGPENQLPGEKEVVENWGDFIEKMGSHALEVKRHVDQVWGKVKKNLKG